MNAQTVLVAIVVLAIGLLVIKKCGGGCCGMKKDAGEGQGDKSDKKDEGSSCCGHKH